MNERQNYLHTVKFGRPQWIPAKISVNYSSLISFKGEMESVMLKFPEFFSKKYDLGHIDYTQYGDGTRSKIETDSWGCTWHHTIYGMEGCVIHHPLENWAAFQSYDVPDPNLFYDRGGRRDWEEEYAKIKLKKKKDELTFGSLVHGFLFLRLQYLRGFENLMVDMALEEPLLEELIRKIDEHNLKIIENYCKAGVDIMELPEDLGAEKSMIISKNMFRKYIKPSYKKMIEPCKKHGLLTCIHSDGYILDILDDLIDIGIDIINPQDLCNGIDNLARILKGRVCIKLDIDRVKVTPNGTRNEIFELIEEEVKALGSKNGGLEFIYGVYPPTPPDNVAYVCEALRKYRTYWWDK
ncbi:MAG: uroporphyrinogen decarboxylase family protein, partial [Parabacteroides sp.]|nr:uroporphyrinogen decarboxylase family protein [Parabacteroides sp.]